jgi:phosphopantetheine adenylyltransferase
VPHILVIANETAASPALLDALRTRRGEEGLSVTIIAPVNEPRHGYVVYEDTRRASAGRRVERLRNRLIEEGIAAQSYAVETGPVQAVKDALVQLTPQPTEIILSTNAPERSSWLRRNALADIEKAAKGMSVSHLIAEDDKAPTIEKNVLVVANETVVSRDLLQAIRARHAAGEASFLIIAPQSDDEHHPEAERRLRRAVSVLRTDGIDAHGQVVHPDPFTAILEATDDEVIDEIIISTFPGQRSGWLRRDLVERVRKETGLPVDHVVSE